MTRTSKFFILLLTLLLLSTYSPNIKKYSSSVLFPVKQISIRNNNIISSEKIVYKLDHIKGKNLMFINNQDINNAIADIDFIHGIKTKKIYPSTIIISIYEKKPVAILIKKKKKFYITDKGNLINFKKLEEYNKLPTVFGENKEFYKLYLDLNKIDFPLYSIKSFLSFEVGRWDIILKNDIIIKLPEINYLESLKNYIEIGNKEDFNKYKIFDYRINNQIILN
ncbi:MAG: FtsQ-type POTRA domain-containing protein [Candidatus Pelagibacter sp. TMED165]|nr:MAG: FtsQ-type POTRA domain-containing protein [Candidatus Pelagibacter sp. TMED165]